ncbi:MAG: hypothetical protein RLZZ292_1277 [Bacteroidota bacterium]|jgi:outer membrane protein
MRKILLLSLVLLAFSQCKKNDAAAPLVNPTPVQTNGGKVVYVNIDTLLEKYNLYQDNKKQLEGDSKKAEQGISGKLESFQRRVADFQRKVYETQQRAQDIAPVELKRLETEFGEQQRKLSEEEASLGKQRDNAAVELDKKLQELQKNLKSKIDTYLEKISAERGYDYVLIKGSTGSVLYGNKALDITNETVLAINAEYAKK